MLCQKRRSRPEPKAKDPRQLQSYFLDSSLCYTSFRMTIGQKFLIQLIKAYQKIAPYIGIRNCCLFEQSCSHYSIAIIQKKGMIKGIFWTILRLLSCQNIIKTPWKDHVKIA